MKVTGFSFIRNALKYDFPVLESITSILPVCDEFIIMVGNSDDETLKLVQSINSEKIKIFPSVWDDTKRTGGKVLAEETNKAISKIASDTDWAFYIQADEIVHEKYLEEIRKDMERYKDDKKVDGLLFKYLHFYGSYDYYASSYSWYRKEIRIIRPGKGIYSYGDAQGFKKNQNEKLKVKEINAFIYHYGWVKHPMQQMKKQKDFQNLWHDDEWIKNNVPNSELFDYSNINSLMKFSETHPKTMLDRIKKQNWKFDFNPAYESIRFKDRMRRFCEKHFGFIPGEYKNYEIIK
jgi:hypothetical protein